MISVKYIGRGGRARTCDNRFWRPVLYQLSYTPVGTKRRRRLGRFKHKRRPDCKGEAVNALFNPAVLRQTWPYPDDIDPANNKSKRER